MLDLNLISTSDPTWFIVRRTNPDLVWPRSAYYFAALFILGSVVRYEPEAMYEITSSHSKWEWLLRRFIANAERFYPNLVVNALSDSAYFFGSIPSI